MSATITRTALAQRQDDGIEVTLLWLRGDDSVAVHVRHLRTGKTFELPVEPDRALDAYYRWRQWRPKPPNPKPPKPPRKASDGLYPGRSASSRSAFMSAAVSSSIRSSATALSIWAM